MKKVLSIIAAMLMCIVFAGAANADAYHINNPYFTDVYTVEESDDNRIVYEFITKKTLSVSSDSSGEIYVALTVKTNETMQKLGFTSLKLQKWSGSSWATEREVTNEFDYTTNSFGYSETFTGLSGGYTYRVKVTIRAKRAQGEVQDMTITSDSIICH